MYQVTSSNDSYVHPILLNESPNEKVYSFDVNDNFWNGQRFDIHILMSSDLTYQNIKVCDIILVD